MNATHNRTRHLGQDIVKANFSKDNDVNFFWTLRHGDTRK